MKSLSWTQKGRSGSRALPWDFNFFSVGALRSMLAPPNPPSQNALYAVKTFEPY